MPTSNTTNGRRTDTTSTATAVRRTIRQHLTGWLIADDPHPEYSRLDRLDGRTRRLTFPVTSSSATTTRRGASG